MKTDRITLGGKDYRIEFNWNATVDFLEAEGLTLGDADQLGNLKPAQITGLIYFGVKEGERLDGKEFNMSIRDFGATLSIKKITEALAIYKKHTEVENVPTAAKKKTTFFHLKK